MGRIVGIDLGTTNTAVAVLQDGRPRVIEDERGYKVLPSVISAKAEGRFVVGQAAHNLILTHPDRTVYATKRLIGRRFDSPEVQRARERLGYASKEAPDGGVLVQVGDQWMSPEEVAAVILQVARTIAERALSETVDEAVITVPAHFNHLQRTKTMEAARIAGLKCDRILNEPTAAALAYGYKRNVDRTLLLFDLGGGTFDVTVLKLNAGVYEILATDGDTYLGGEDFDYRVVDYLADHFQARSGVDVREDRNALQRLKDAAERAKCDLSFSDRTNVVVAHITPQQSLEMILSRQTLESLTVDLVERCIEITRRAVTQASLQVSDIDEVVIVGGQTRMPRVREAVSALFGREPSRSVHPEEAVAIGAAVHANTLADPEAPAAVLLDVTPFDLGIDSVGGMFTPVIGRNARIPCAETRTFATFHDNQSNVRITVRQGESRLASENEFLGEFVMEGLPPAPRLQTKLDVSFRIDANGMLNVGAVERATKEKKAITVRNYAERAQAPAFPSAEEADKDRAAAIQRAEAVESGGKAAPATAGTAAKAGFLSSLFGASKSASKTAVAKAGAAPAAPEVPPTPAEIDLSAVPLDAVEPVPIDAEEKDEPTPRSFTDSGIITALPDEDDDVYGGATPAGVGLAGARDPASSALRGEASAPSADPFGADEPDPAELVDEDASEKPRYVDPFLGRPVAAERAAPPPAADPTIAAPMLTPTIAPPAMIDADPPERGADHGYDASALFGGAPAQESTGDPATAPPRTGLGLGTIDGGPPTPPMAPAAAEPPHPEPPAEAKKKKKPARLKLHYRERDAFLAEYRDNLRRGGTFIRTDKPLAVGRDCIFEIDAPGLVEPIVFSAVVSWISTGREGQPAGMGVEYRLDERERATIERALARM